ncbi:MAG: GNAT family N-acetyltransferase [Thermoplasmatota archaeon]
MSIADRRPEGGQGVGNFLIRRFRVEDLPEVTRLVESAFRERYDPQMYINLHQSWPDGLQVVEFQGRIIAFLLGMVSGPRQARVLLLAVEPIYRCLGLGSRLLNSFLDAARALPVDVVTLEVRMSNQRALAFYYRLGFIVTGMIPRYYRDGESAHVMSRWLR